jgi:hypothetical protein
LPYPFDFQGKSNALYCKFFKKRLMSTLSKTLATLQQRLGDIQQVLELPDLFSESIASLGSLVVPGAFKNPQDPLTNENARMTMTQILESVIVSLSKTWNPPITDPHRALWQECLAFALDAIREFGGGNALEPPNFSPLTDTFLNAYILSTYPRAKDKARLYRAVKPAYEFTAFRDMRFFLAGIHNLSQFINTASVTYDAFVTNLETDFLYFLSAAHKFGYTQIDGFNSSAGSFLHNASLESPDACFTLLEHFYDIYTLALPRKVRTRESIAILLYRSYSTASASTNLAELQHYTLSFSRVAPDASAGLFSGLTGALRKCFQNTPGVTGVDFGPALAALFPLCPESVTRLGASRTFPAYLEVLPLRVVDGAVSPVLQSRCTRIMRTRTSG